MESAAESKMIYLIDLAQGVTSEVLLKSVESNPRSAEKIATKRDIIMEAASSPNFGAKTTAITMSFCPISLLTYFFLVIHFQMLFHKLPYTSSLNNFVLDNQ